MFKGTKVWVLRVLRLGHVDYVHRIPIGRSCWSMLWNIMLTSAVTFLINTVHLIQYLVHYHNLSSITALTILAGSMF